jgi:hypothetical protein
MAFGLNIEGEETLLSLVGLVRNIAEIRDGEHAMVNAPPANNCSVLFLWDISSFAI